MRAMTTIGIIGFTITAGSLAACAGGDNDAPASAQQDFAEGKPTKAECDTLDKQVDACLDELGSIGGSLDDCIGKKNPQATACCAAHGKTFNFCR